MELAKEKRVKETVERIRPHLNIEDDPKIIYKLELRLGRGSYGDVFKAIHIPTNKIHAVKIIKVESVKIEDVFKEIEILANCDSPFIGNHICFP